MKRFTVISVLFSISVNLFACAWQDSHNYYLFSIYDSNEFSRRVNEITMNNWRAYLGTGVDFPFFDDCMTLPFYEDNGGAT